MRRQTVSGVILAGGRASRMGGVDKGLQPYRGMPLVLHVLQRLAPQVGTVVINANRHLDTYRTFGVGVHTDAWARAVVQPEAPDASLGPLVGFLTGLQACQTPWLVAVPCDAPHLPTDLVERLARAAHAHRADVALPASRDDGVLRTQPAFCLMRSSVQASLRAFISEGGRKIETWTAQQRRCIVPFEADSDTQAFFNANTLADLQR